MCVQLFSKMDPTTQAYEYMSTHYGVGVSSLFSPHEAFLCMCRQERFFDLWSGHLISFF